MQATATDSTVISLRNRIDRAAQCYYYGTPVCQDRQYDQLLEDLRAACPDDPRLTRVGYPVPPHSMLQKVRHTTFTGSLEKVESEIELGNWYVKTGGELLCMYKVDGASLVLYYTNGVLERAVTRGGDDGIGEDVTANATRMVGVPMHLNSQLTVAVRGEAVLPIAAWKLLDPQQIGNPRNIGTGMLRRVEGGGAELLEFLAFDHSLPGYNEDQKLCHLRDVGFTVPKYRLCTHSSAIQFYQETCTERGDIHFWIDGVVFKVNDHHRATELGYSHNRPRGQRVLKFTSPGTETTLLDITLTMGHTGALIPTAKLAPCNIAGTVVRNALLNNFEIIEALDLGIGDTVYVEKAMDIIPYLSHVVSRPAHRKPIMPPTTCPFCTSAIHQRELTTKHKVIMGRVLECRNLACPGRIRAKLNTWITKLSIKGIGDGLLDALIQQLHVQTPAHLYQLTIEQLADVRVGAGRLGMSRATAVHTEIVKTKNLSLNQLLGSLGVPHLGRRRVQLIREAIPGELDTVADWLGGRLLQVADRAGVPNIAAEINAGMLAAAPLLSELLRVITVEEQPMPTSKTGGLSGRVFCFTGKIETVDEDGQRYTRERMQQLVLDNGGGVTDDIRGHTTDLVQADVTSQSSKSKKARQNGVNVMSEVDFFGLLNG